MTSYTPCSEKWPYNFATRSLADSDQSCWSPQRISN